MRGIKLFNSTATSHSFFFVVCQWSMVLFGYGHIDEAWGQVERGRELLSTTNKLSVSVLLTQAEHVYWLSFLLLLLFLPDPIRFNINKYVLLCKLEVKRCWVTVILLVTLFFLDITSCPLCPVFLVLMSERISRMANRIPLGINKYEKQKCDDELFTMMWNVACPSLEAMSHYKVHIFTRRILSCLLVIG